MAEVFVATLHGASGFTKKYAIKQLLPELSADPDLVQMLLDEARIAGAIDHPNVLQVLDVGRTGEIFYLVMEYVDGKDLRSIAKRIPGGRLPLGMALHAISEMLRGLNAVHTAVDERGKPRNIVHRDISPGNVMVDRRGFVKLGDFGIAHASGRITRTRVGAIKGKSRYMAPEQLQGAALDHRADLYAVGVTLFEAILGDFARESSTPTIYGPMFVWPERMPQGAIPADVEALLRKAVHTAPEMRYRDAEEFRADLDVALHRWAPGYGPDVLARELRRVLGDAPPERPGAPPPQVRAVRWRGVPTAEHAATPRDSASISVSASVSASGATVGQGTARQGVTTATQATLSPRRSARPRLPSRGLFEGAQTVDEVRTPPPERFDRSTREESVVPRLRRRFGAGFLVAALALITVAIAAAVAVSGGTSAPDDVKVAPVVTAAAPRTEPRAVQLPTASPASRVTEAAVRPRASPKKPRPLARAIRGVSLLAPR